jgi:putative MATE family efflux protein
VSKTDLTTAPIAPTLVKLTGPMLIGILSMVGFNIVDTYFVGQLGKNELAALTFTFPVILVIFSVAQGIGIGATALISQSIGKNDFERAARETTDSLVLSIILVLVFVAVGILTIDPVFTAIGADEVTLPLVKEYMYIWFFTLIFVMVPFVGNSAIRATGDTKTPSYIMLFAVFINALLDPLLIFGYGSFKGLGLQGAALATAISRGFTLLLSLYILYYREKLITLNIPSKQVLSGCWKAILRIAVPTAASRMITPVAAGIVTSIIASHGPEVVAAFGIGNRVEIFSLAILFALSAVISPFVGQNLGKHQYERIRTAINYSLYFSVAWGIFVALIFWQVAEPVARIFNQQPEVIEAVVLFLTIVPFSFGLQGLFQVINASLNTINRPGSAFIISVVQMFVIYVPCAYLGNQYFGLKGVFSALALSYVIGGVTTYFTHRVQLKKIADAYYASAKAPVTN